MAYMVYEFKDTDTIEDVAIRNNTTVAEIMKINNISPPYPVYFKDLPGATIAEGTVQIPLVTNGGQSFEEYNETARVNLGVYYSSEDSLKNNMYENSKDYSVSYFSNKDLSPGRHPANCYIAAGTIGNPMYFYSTDVDYTFLRHNVANMAAMYFPCYPESVSDSNTATYTAVPILGRSEPFQYYTGSGPRTVSVDFKLHSDMCDDINYIYRLAAFIEACCYPNYGSSIAPIQVIFHCANNIHIVGIITSVNTSYEGPILDMQPGPTMDYNGSDMIQPKYAQVNISFSITEVTGDPPSFSDIAAQGGLRNAIQ